MLGGVGDNYPLEGCHQRRFFAFDELILGDGGLGFVTFVRDFW